MNAVKTLFSSFSFFGLAGADICFSSDATFLAALISLLASLRFVDSGPDPVFP
jgi:hypothetical protein